ncbi:hypothetical protein Btru_048395 [Bulinus truncatus]|nr:hypothetical protein Btru_048395 [Bulinus truncatus]
MLTIKSVDDNASVANNINMLLRMSLGELVLNLSKEMDKEEKAYLMVRIDRLRIDSALTVHGYAAYATLGGIQLVDKIHVGHSGEYMEVLSTNTVSNNNLVSIVYRKVDPVCPDFATYYGGVEHAIKIKILSLSTLFDQASMMYLHAFVQSILSSVQNLDMKTSTSSIMTASEISMKDKVSFTKHLANITDQVEDLPANGTKVHIIAELQDFSVKLTDSDNHLAEVKIMLLQDESVFDFKLVKYNKKPNQLDNVNTNCGLDYSIRLWLGQIQAAILGKFYWEITRFFEPFINQEMTEAAKLTAATTVAKQVSKFESDSLRISVNIEVRTPTLLLPHDSKSTEMLLVQLGNLSIRNSFLTVDFSENVKQELNDIHVNLSNIQVQRVCLNLVEDSTEIIHTIIEPLSFTSNIKIAMRPVVDLNKLDISGHVEKFKVYILQKDIQLILGVLRYNFTESSPPPSPGMYESPTILNLQGQQQRVNLELHPTSDVELHTPDSPPIFQQKTVTRFVLQLDGLSVTLFTDNGKEFATRTSLCLLDLEKISLCGMSKSDGELNVDISLLSVDLSDTRPDSNLAVKRVLECITKVKNPDLPLVSLKYMINTDGNHKAEIEVEKLQMNVNTPFMLVLLDFFNGAMETVNQSSKKDSPSLVNENSFVTPSGGYEEQSALLQKSFTIEGFFKQPEIVLYGDPTQADSRVLVLYSDMSFKITKDSMNQNIWSKITNLKLISKATFQSPVNNLVMYPCSVELTHHLNMLSGASESTVSISKVEVFVSPSVMQLFWDKKTSVATSASDTSVQGLWVVSKVTSEKWLKDRSEVASHPNLKPTSTPKESFQLDIKDINFYFEIETLDLHVPILCLHTSVQSKIEEWSRKMHIEAELHLEMMYFNENLSVWEPLIEPVMEKECVYRPWELIFKAVRAKSFPMICMYDDNDVNIPEELQVEVQQMMHRSRLKSSSSETDDQSADQDVKVIRHKSLNRLRHGSDRSFDELDVTNILIAREQAKLEFAKEAPERATKLIKKKKGWFHSWFSDSEEDDVIIDVDQAHKKDWLSSLTSEEKEKLYDSIGYDDSNRNISYPKKYVASKIQVILKRCCVSMVNYSKKILQVSVTHLLSTFEYRPGDEAFRISCNTESFAVEGASIEHELIPILTSDIGVYAPSVNQVFTLDFESKPLYMDADYSLSLNVQPVEVVYDEHSISEVTAFFQLPQGGLDIKSAAVKTFTNVAYVSQAGLQYIIETHTTVHIALNMRSPYIVIPEYGTLHRGGNVLIIDLGTLRIESELQPKDVSLEDATMSEIESRLYDQFNIKISDVKVLLADSADDWHTAQIQPNSEYHILPSVQLIVTFFNAVKPDFTQLPRHKLEAKVPSLEVNISDKRMLLLATFLRNFPIPTSSSMATIGEDMTDSHAAANLTSFHLDLAEAQLEPDLHELRSIRRSVLGRSLIDKTDGPRRSLSKVPTLMYTRGDEPFYSASDYSDEDLDKLSE